MSESEIELKPERSIHWRQRWWYGVWVTLLLSSLAFWGWWETPAAMGTGHVVLRIWVSDIPAGSRVQAWTGPRKSWSKNQEAPGIQGSWTVLDASKPLPLPPLEIHVGLRHWHQGYIPRLTSDRIVLRFDPPQGPPRFAGYNLEQDLNSGLAGPHRRLFLSLPLRWAAISTDASRPSPLLP